jgi:hypothetical protein
MAEEFGVTFLGIRSLKWLTIGRAPIDPNFVLAIERNQQNQINLASENRGEVSENANGSIKTIIDEYKELVLCDIFKGIVAKLVPQDTAVQK